MRVWEETCHLHLLSQHPLFVWLVIGAEQRAEICIQHPAAGQALRSSQPLAFRCRERAAAARVAHPGAVWNASKFLQTRSIPEQTHKEYFYYSCQMLKDSKRTVDHKKVYILLPYVLEASWIQSEKETIAYYTG